MDLEITENDKRKRHKKDENKTAKADQCIFSQPVWEQQGIGFYLPSKADSFCKGYGTCIHGKADPDQKYRK